MTQIFEHYQNPKFTLPEAAELLKSLSSRAYHRMADIDRQLRGKGYPKKVTLKNVSSEIQNMDKFIDNKINDELAMHKKKHWINEFYKEHPFLFWLITLLFSTIVTIAIA